MNRDELDIRTPVTVHIQLLDEGTSRTRPIQALPIGKGLFMVLATRDYDPKIERWEFLPGSIVRLAVKTDPDGATYSLAVKV